MKLTFDRQIFTQSQPVAMDLFYKQLMNILLILKHIVPLNHSGMTHFDHYRMTDLFVAPYTLSNSLILATVSTYSLRRGASYSSSLLRILAHITQREVLKCNFLRCSLISSFLHFLILARLFLILRRSFSYYFFSSCLILIRDSAVSLC